MLETFVIALREGLEAALIVGILVAYLKKSGREQLMRPLVGGVAAAIAVALAFGALLTFTSASLGKTGEPLFAGLTGLTAVALVTWMIFWMKKTARHLKSELENRAALALTEGALFLAAFTAVVREGLETALFLYANFKATAVNPVGSSFALLAGVAASAALGYALYKGSIKFNLGTFFKVSGVALILIAANVLSMSLHEFAEVGYLPEINKAIALLYVIALVPLYLSNKGANSKNARNEKKAPKKILATK